MTLRPVWQTQMPEAVADLEAMNLTDWNLMVGHLQCAIDIAEEMPDGRRALGEALSGALDTVGQGAPGYHLFGDIRADAEWWADCATPIELELIAVAALRRIERTPFAPRARKRLFRMLWDSFSEDDKRRFLRFVKEQG